MAQLSVLGKKDLPGDFKVLQGLRTTAPEGSQEVRLEVGATVPVPAQPPSPPAPSPELTTTLPGEAVGGHVSPSHSATTEIGL